MANFELEFTNQICEIQRLAAKLELIKVRDENGVNLTANEIRLIEKIKLSSKGGEGPTISDIAYQLDITRPSATVAVNKLEIKRLVEKTDCENDKRSVRVKLTPKGEKAYSFLKKHKNALASAMKERFSSKERAQLADSLEKLGGFLANLLEENAGES